MRRGELVYSMRKEAEDRVKENAKEDEKENEV